MTDNQDITLSIEEENELGRESAAGHVNYANDFTENPELISTKDQDLPKADIVFENEIVVDSKENESDEWWNHVNSLVKSEEAATSENNNCITIEGWDTTFYISARMVCSCLLRNHFYKEELSLVGGSSPLLSHLFCKAFLKRRQGARVNQAEIDPGEFAHVWFMQTCPWYKSHTIERNLASLARSSYQVNDPPSRGTLSTSPPCDFSLKGSQIIIKKLIERSLTRYGSAWRVFVLPGITDFSQHELVLTHVLPPFLIVANKNRGSLTM